MEYYKPARRPGKYIIFNNIFYEGEKPPSVRVGAKSSTDKIKRTLDSLNFESIGEKICEDYDVGQIYSTLETAIAGDFTDYGSLIVITGTHGIANYKRYARDDLYDFKDFVEYVTKFASPTLDGKPKIFIDQACNGNKMDNGSPYSLPEIDEGYPLLIPQIPDLLLAFSSSQGFVSNRFWLFDHLCSVIEMYHTQHDIETMLTLVKSEVAEKKCKCKNDIFKQMPTTISTLTKKFKIT